MILKPTISLHGSGDAVELSNLGGRFMLTQGASGLGWTPQVLEVADLASGGGVVRHRRGAVAEVMIPVMLGGDYQERFEDRRRLERLCADTVEIRVSQPGGEVRSRFGLLKDGLEGSYASGEDASNGQQLVLTFSCPDPWWYGLPREVSTRINALRKPLVSADGAEVVRRNLFPNPGVEYGRGSFSRFTGVDSQVFSTTNDAKSGDSALRVDVVEGSGSPHVLTPQFSAPVGSVVELAMEVKASPEVTHVRMTAYERDGAAGVAGTLYYLGWSPLIPVSGEFSRVSWRTPVTRRENLRFRVELFRDDGSGPVDAPAGSWIVLDEFIAEVGQVGLFFDGDTPDTATVTHEWEGTPGNSPSVRRVDRSDIQLTPFFPVVLSDSTIQGAHVLEVQGDAEVWPTWTITGPGEDLLIQNDVTGERIFISGDFGEQVTVVTRPQEQDVFSMSSDRGGLWDRVSLDSVLFPLQPGKNRIRMSMVNAKPSSAVTLSYRERYRAGH